MTSKINILCGITGIWAKNNTGKIKFDRLKLALDSIGHRGPDNTNIKLYSNCALGHVRLSIIDTDKRSNQPFVSADERYALVFNGEIYNYKTLRLELEKEGVLFETDSDTEVLLNLLIKKGVKALEVLNGFFAFAFYDLQEDTLLLARDRMGIKPLLINETEDYIAFASELQAFFDINADQEIDREGLNYFFGLTYIPAPNTVLKNVKKLEPGTYAVIKENTLSIYDWYSLEQKHKTMPYKNAQKMLFDLLEKSVQDRLIADVPLGSFLSGGIDSSIIAALAKKQKSDLKTFSVGFDHTYFNETEYAQEVADFIGSDHTVFTLTKSDFKTHFNDFLNAIDEPFADSSAFAVYLLAQKTKKEVTVALSGDGADELFGGYRKHWAEFQIQSMQGVKKAGINFAAASLKGLKKNRSDRWGEFNRKLQKLSYGLKLDETQRYWNWCNFIQEADRKRLLNNNYFEELDPLKLVHTSPDLNSIFYADQQLVLPNDMLKKVDSMSMASALEVRTPFLDHKVVEFANALPASFKVGRRGGKLILKDTFASILPEAVISRSKKGFEIPIKEWLNDEINSQLDGDLFSRDFIVHQGIFDADYIKTLKTEWSKPDFGDKIYMIWALLIFQHWWNRYLN